jgi:hypothetical protein
MTTVTDEQLNLHADRVNGKVVVITGDGVNTGLQNLAAQT